MNIPSSNKAYSIGPIRTLFVCLLFFLFVFVYPPLANATEKTADKTHANLYKNNQYPSANTCKTCHPRQYREWSVSQHAYAQLSPIFMAMNNTSHKEQSGTLGDFCIRCHTPIGMALGESPTISNLNRHAISREGVTCIACHRVNENYGKTNARTHLVKGNITKPIYGPTGNSELARVLTEKNTYKVKTDKKETGRKIHKKVERFFALTTPRFCGTCHDVTLVNGARLEEAYSEYRHSPAARAGKSCQDCHMGKVPGQAKGYNRGPAAIIGEKPTRIRKIANHYFAGPDYPVVHPGIFPVNLDAQELASLKEWLTFDYRAGWGTDNYEDKVSDKKKFPAPWDSADARYDARDILDEQFRLLRWAKKQRQTILSHAYRIDDVTIHQASPSNVDFTVTIANGTDGHNAPTGFIAERLVFLQVTLTDAHGKIVYQSGDRDPNLDVRDSHSAYVHAGVLKQDKDLLSLQSHFTLRNIRGSERKTVLPINRSFDPRPFVRPSTFSALLTGRPANARIHRRALPRLGKREAHYHIDEKALSGTKGPYTLDLKLIAQMVPVNLITRIQGVGFDYGLSGQRLAKEVVRQAHTVAKHRLSIKVTS